MSQPEVSENKLAGLSREEINSALFAQMVMQQANMAMMLMGKVAHPETGQTIRDVEAARMFIDQLEMLETKTKGNLTRDEEMLLKQSLMTLHLAFVESVEAPAASEKPVEAPKSEAPARLENMASTPPPAEESPKRFSKKY